jgi:hypothetical protein
MRIFLAAILIFTFEIAFANPVCFKNQAEFNAIKAKLPQILQEIPAYFTFKGLIVSAAGSAKFENGDLRFFFNCTHQLDEPIEDRVTVCATEKEIQFIFDNKTIEKVAINSQNEINIRGQLDLKKSTKDQFFAMAKFITDRSKPASQKQNNPNQNRGNL